MSDLRMEDQDAISRCELCGNLCSDLCNCDEAKDAEIASLRAQLDGMKRAAEVRDGTVSALNETCVNQGFEIADLKTKLDEANERAHYATGVAETNIKRANEAADEARRKAIEDCAAIADRWTSPEQRLHGHGGAGAEILALLSESKT